MCLLFIPGPTRLMSSSEKMSGIAAALYVPGVQKIISLCDNPDVATGGAGMMHTPVPAETPPQRPMSRR